MNKKYIIANIKVSIVKTQSAGADYTDHAAGHWINDTIIANPMSVYNDYQHSRSAWGMDVLKGIFTDGDLRRALGSGIDFKFSKIKDVMTKNAKTIVTNSLAASALALMETHSINALVVVDEKEMLHGILNMHDLLRARVI